MIGTRRAIAAMLAGTVAFAASAAKTQAAEGFKQLISAQQGKAETANESALNRAEEQRDKIKRTKGLRADAEALDAIVADLRIARTELAKLKRLIAAGCK